MKAPWQLSAIFLVLLANNSYIAGAANVVPIRRQDVSFSPPPATSTNSPLPSSMAPSSAIPSSEISSAISSGSANTAPASHDKSFSTSMASSSSASATRAPEGGNITTSSGIVFGPSATPIANTTMNGTTIQGPAIDGLPIQPTITPAIAVAGALMIVTGAFYTLIGIKTQRLHIFFSATYLVALAVTVLVEYVMHPPIPNGIQGAYFVAACVSGLVFGALAVVFADVTEGLGCFLGGFCLSMWFLVLKPDGLITSTAGKSIFIGCFTVGIFVLYISHYTRVYGLIGSTSFAGATVIVLGIDCFSRAGLKEFWLYIWNLNSAIFPLNYMGPYPITRGIRVEIAAIILIFILGVMSQMKVWKIVKQRREARAAEQLRKDEERDRAEEALGRRIEAGNSQERSWWDAVYGDKTKLKETHADSGIGTEAASTTAKSSISVGDARELSGGGMEMQVLGKSRFSSEDGGRVTVHVAQDDEISEAPKALPRGSEDSANKISRQPSIEGGDAEGANNVESEPKSTKSKASPSIDPGLTLKPKTKQPKFVPLPFTVPDESDAHSRKPSDASSVATFAASEHFPDPSKRSSKRLSGSGLMRKLSGRSQKDPVVSSISQEALMIPHVEDDRSSIAATLDGVSDHIDAESVISLSMAPSRQNLAAGDEEMVTAPQTPMAFPSPPEATSGTPKIDFPTTPAPTGPNAESSSDVDVSNEKDTVILAPAEAPQPLARQSSLIAGNLPGGSASKVVNAYRTNEWAKHLDGADAPAIEDNTVQKSKVTDGEEAAPLNIRALSQTPLTAEPAPNVTIDLDDKAQLPSNRSPSRTTEKPVNPYRPQQSPQPSRPGSSGSAVVNNMERTTSQSSPSSSTSSLPTFPMPKTRTSTNSLLGPRAFRTSSSPLVGTPLVESPIEEGVEASFPHSRFTPSSSHLMSQRESMLRNKASSTSLLRSGSATSLKRVSSTPITAGSSNVALNPVDEDDNISLSQRKSMLQQQQQSLSRSSSGTTTPFNPSRVSLNSNNPYGQTARLSAASNLQLNNNLPHTARPHLPAAATSEAAISNWRASLAQLPRAEVMQQQEMELRRQDLLAEKNAVRSSRAFEEQTRQQRESVLGREMRRTSMMDAHREAMRKMQASVNDKLKPTGT